MLLCNCYVLKEVKKKMDPPDVSHIPENLRGEKQIVNIFTNFSCFPMSVETLLGRNIFGKNNWICFNTGAGFEVLLSE